MNNLDPCRKLAALLRAAFTVLIIAGSLATRTPGRADNPPTFLFGIDSSAVPGGFGPSAIAIDGSNNLFVTSGETVVKFSSPLTQWGTYGSKNGQFNDPSGIAADSSNNVYMGDYNNDRIEKFDCNCSYLAQWDGYGSDNTPLDNPYLI